MIDFLRPNSFLGSVVHATEEARFNDSVRFFRVASALGIARRSTLLKFSRYIRYGFLSVQDAQDLIYGRLSREKVYRYSLAKYWIKCGFVEESWFYFKPSALWRVDVPKLENITLFQ